MPARLLACQLLFLFGCLSAGCSSVPEAELSETEVVGRVVGHDGQPLKKVRLLLSRVPALEILSSTDADGKGNFSLTTEKTGVLLLRVQGLHHEPETVAFYVTGPERIELELRLATLELLPEPDSLFLLTAPPFEAPELNSQPFVQRSDGTYGLEVDTQLERVAYGIEGMTPMGLVMGTDSGEFADRAEYFYPYSTVVDTQDGKLKIDFDPGQLPQSKTSSQVRFVEDRTGRTRFNQIMNRMLSRQQAYNSNSMKVSLPLDASLVQGLLREIDEEQNPVLRKALLMDYFHLTVPALEAEPEMVVKILEEIGPDSPFWWFQLWGSQYLIGRLADALSVLQNPEQYRDYWLEILENLPEKDWQAVGYASWFSFANGLAVGRSKSDENRASRWAYLATDIDKIAREAISRFPDHPWVKFRVEGYFAKTKPLAAGNQIPEFSVPSLEDPTIRYTSQNISAKVYLIYFWGTWCGTCTVQFPPLHRLYEEFSPLGFEILGYSLDDNREVVRTFRKKRWPQPWLMAMEPEKGLEADILRDFNLRMAGAKILVKEGGEILAFNPNEAEIERLLGQELR